METAAHWKWQPLVMFGFKAKRTPAPRSVLLAEALTIYKASIHSACGQSALLAFDPYNSGEYELRTDAECVACQELSKGEDRDVPAGTVTYLANHLSEGR